LNRRVHPETALLSYFSVRPTTVNTLEPSRYVNRTETNDRIYFSRAIVYR